MKPFNKEKYNKLCAEFLGLVEAKPYKGAYTTHNSNNVPSSFSNLFHSEMEGEDWYVYPKFDSDWNWIMEVVEKIESLGYESLLSGSEYYYPEKGMRYVQSFIKDDFIVVNNLPTKIEAVIQAIWEFLNWYNENK